MKKDKDIIFWTDVKGLPEIEPIRLGQNFIPEWFQNAPSFHNQKESIHSVGEGGTIKLCPGLGDFFKMGYVVSLWCDLYVELNDTEEWKWRVQFCY